MGRDFEEKVVVLFGVLGLVVGSWFGFDWLMMVVGNWAGKTW